jgi:hypothetical protein
MLATVGFFSLLQSLHVKRNAFPKKTRIRVLGHGSAVETTLHISLSVSAVIA